MMDISRSDERSSPILTGAPEELLKPLDLAEWRARPLGARTESLEMAVIFCLAGSLEGKSLLDVGAGDGAYVLEAARRGARVTALDASVDMIAALEQRAQRVRLAVTGVVGDAASLPFAEASFDVVMAITALCFVGEPDRAIREMARVARPGGRVVIGELGRWSSWALRRRVQAWRGSKLWQEARFTTAKELQRRLLLAGLTVEKVRGAVFYPPARVAARLLGPVDEHLERWLRPFGAFVAVVGVKPEELERGMK